MRLTCRQGGRKSLISGWLLMGTLAAVVSDGAAIRASELAGDRARATAVLASASESTPDAVTMGGNANRGRLLYLQCRACHSLEKGGINTVGPNLHGLFGSAAGNIADFVYSEALLASGVVWSQETLDAWLAAPSDFVPGNRMIFSGVADSEDRADLIAYIQQATASEEN